MGFDEVFLWACLAIFVIVASLWLLDMASVITIRDPNQKKILNFALGTTLVGGMATFAATNFFDSADGQPSPTKETPQTSSSATYQPSLASPAPQRGSSKPTDPTAESSDSSGLSSEIVEFLAANDLRRPTIASAWNTKYPTCAVNARSKVLAKRAARDCFLDLDKFNQQVLKPYQEAYDDYVPQVAELSYAQPAGAVLNFLREDAAGFTQGTNDVASLYRSISGNLDSDYAMLRRQAYGQIYP